MPSASLAEIVVNALGGVENIADIEGCITRIRVEVEDPALIDKSALKRAGAFGVVVLGNSAQVVMGTQSDAIAVEIQDCM
ncbi:glucose PTS transporter subunit EIIB [Streptomyces sp. NBC_01264]|uniref:glucose PTS transporter subunit EIIB n=1 Tax=Streptomyces sp. NBC_01264 TaxID=2903804 RepID=UPI0022501726|nr:glucose PTS transporter subunit EIIB [Streptomyces sp. NBC_01264]MCX4784328.1 glucose PTS transporter subunit EIIB [Streptomyces sp. NBC_01264]